MAHPSATFVSNLAKNYFKIKKNNQRSGLLVQSLHGNTRVLGLILVSDNFSSIEARHIPLKCSIPIGRSNIH
jgi:hypothetical protein